MFNSAVLEVAIVLAFTYLLLSLICTTLNEWITRILKTRATMLEQGIQGLLAGQKITVDGKSFADLFAAHPLIAGLRQDPSKPPSYIAPRAFALTVMDLVTQLQPGSITFVDLETGIKNLPEGCVKTSLLAAIQNAEGSLTKAQAGIENWFNDAMDRVSGWFTRRQHSISIVLAVLITIFANADSLSMANRLWISPTLRQEIVAKAATAPDPNSPKNPQVDKPDDTPFKGELSLQSQLGDLVGWNSDYTVRYHGNLGDTVLGAFRHIPGWLLTIFAVSLGAPFWFDLLSKFMSVRSSGPPPDEAQKP